MLLMLLLLCKSAALCVFLVHTKIVRTHKYVLLLLNVAHLAVPASRLAASMDEQVGSVPGAAGTRSWSLVSFLFALRSAVCAACALPPASV